MKLSALLSRAKGRDFYDAMFLLALTDPDYAFLKARAGIETAGQLKSALLEMLAKTDLMVKKRDFEHMLFCERNSEKILKFADYIEHRLS